ncbi:hypothetical protein [Sulfitobacter donghicola]|uniref:Peptidase M15 n=1 Tax=Sulfitobacter donghicola DSW-25 = KCTC 12864 = JCM 14565 TaxID=1300350 RepID=A0A073IX63_9RHOB|nr:hypothetical protein [Sulfitobacter donghicola]KEJ89967.1 hypothetical protein DSW25_07075 [Sulfitobacter donghicola DSW-25 = KCTC 12864 = JCM 14565]
MWSLETFGRVRLSKHFYMRDFLMSEISAFHGIPNIPDDPDLAIKHGKALCQHLLDPLEETFGRIAIRSGYRSTALNTYGNENKLNCARSDNPIECHIWDHKGEPVAGTSLVIPWFADQYDEGRDWRDLAWWVHDHLPYSEMWFFPKLAAFNLVWRPNPQRTISSYIAPRGMLLRAGEDPAESLATRQARYADFPPLRGIEYP